ncbi:MAG: TRAP transporter TatT component family protein [Polyangiales bacterium]
MTSSQKFGHWTALACMVAIAAGCGSTREGAWETSSGSVVLDESAKAQETQLVAAAQAAWLQRGDAAQAQAAIDNWQQAVDINPGNAQAWTDLSHAQFFYADCHARWDEANPDARKLGHETGIKSAERALGAQSAAFNDKMAAGDRIETAIEVLGPSAVPALYWRSSNLGAWASLESFATLLSYKDEVRAIMEFCLNNDPEYWYQGPDRYFGIFYARAPGFSGGDMTKSMEHFQRSIEAHPNYLGTHTYVASEWAVKEVDRPLFDQQLDFVLASDPNVIPAISPENVCEQRKAKDLMAEADDLF